MTGTKPVKPDPELPLFNKGVSLLCWAYNEEDSIGKYLEKATALLDSTVSGYEIILIDDGSTDRTYEIAEKFREKNPRLKIYRNGKNLNIGPSFVKAVQMASKDFLFWQTIDWSYDIRRLRSFLELLCKYDVVAGVRRAPVLKTNLPHKRLLSFLKVFGIQHITTRSDTVSKAIISLINYFLIRLLFRVPVSDFQNVVFYPTKWIKTVTLEARSSFSNPELLIKAYWSGMTIKEVPISFIPRSAGTAKGTKIKALFASSRDVFTLWFRWNILGRIDHSHHGAVIRLEPETGDAFDEASFKRPDENLSSF